MKQKFIIKLKLFYTAKDLVGKTFCFFDDPNCLWTYTRFDSTKLYYYYHNDTNRIHCMPIGCELENIKGRLYLEIT